MKRSVLAALFLLGGCVSQVPTGPSITPTAHTDFRHDTLALTWQPGFCATGGGCEWDQTHRISIGLHGLWASEPHALEAQGVPVQEWWSKGCDLYDHNDTPPQLLPTTVEALRGVVPHLKKPLYVHEYTKHARCFGYDADRFFITSMEMRDRFAASAFGLWLAQQSGFQVNRDDMLATFARLMNVRDSRALQVRCEPAHNGQMVLTQLWFTLDPKKLSRFPYEGAYLSSPDDQNGCPATFLVPGWTAPSAADQRP